MDPRALLFEACAGQGPVFDMLLTHGRVVADKARRILAGCREGAGADLDFVVEAAIVHDIGAAFTHAPVIGLHGAEPYLRHGVIGKGFLDERGFPRHGRVCERHVGVGLTAVEIGARGLPLPLRDMRPETVEEIGICLADKFFSKLPGRWQQERSLEEVRQAVGRHGQDKVATLDGWIARFGLGG